MKEYDAHLLGPGGICERCGQVLFDAEGQMTDAAKDTCRKEKQP